MTRARLIFTFGLLALLSALPSLTACSPDPRRQADADATRLQAESQVASDEQARAQDAQEHEIKTNFVKTAAPYINAAIKTSLIALMFTAFVVIASFGVGMSAITISAGIATSRRNLSRPNQFKLDKSTHQFPLLMTPIGEGRYTLTNPNTNSVTYLNERNEGDKLMIQAMAATQFIGEMATRASLSHKPEAIASITTLPQIIDMES